MMQPIFSLILIVVSLVYLRWFFFLVYLPFSFWPLDVYSSSKDAWDVEGGSERGLSDRTWRDPPRGGGCNGLHTQTSDLYWLSVVAVVFPRGSEMSYSKFIVSSPLTEGKFQSFGAALPIPLWSFSMLCGGLLWYGLVDPGSILWYGLLFGLGGWLLSWFLLFPWGYTFICHFGSMCFSWIC